MRQSILQGNAITCLKLILETSYLTYDGYLRTSNMDRKMYYLRTSKVDQACIFVSATLKP